MSGNHYDLISQASKDARVAAKLLYVSTAKYGGDWNSMPHTHACAEMFYVVGGKGQFRIEDQLYPVQENDLIIVNPHVRHTETSLDASPLEYIVLGVEGLELMVKEDENRPFCIISFKSSGSDIQFFLRSMLRELEAKAPGYEDICQDLLDIFVIRLMRGSDFSAKLIPSTVQVSKEGAAVHRYIETHFKENVSLDDLAEVAHLNKYHMTHLFTRDYGISPIKFLLSLRIKESCYLLRMTDHPLAQIARITGFSSPSYFSQSFRKSEGISPTDYRNKYHLSNKAETEEENETSEESESSEEN